MAEARVYTPATLAEKWGCSERHVRNLIERGDLGAFKLGGRLVRITAADVAAYERGNDTAVVPPQEDAPGTIYFVAHADRVKIGFTSDLAKRLESLGFGSPVELTLLHSQPGSRRDERALHERFRESRLHGEWFRLTDEIKAYIAEASGK